MNDERCGHEKADGEPCRGWVTCDRCEKCYAHCEHVEEERQEARSKGGRTTAQRHADGDAVVPVGDAPDAPESLDDAVRWASWASLQVATGQLDTTRANSVARLLSEFRKLLEKSESREALEKIEELRQAVKDGDAADADLEVVE